MGLSLNFCLAEQCDCKTALFNDTTGLYDAVTNTGGWGVPNTLSSSVTLAFISITPKGYISPITFTFKIASNIITAALRTDEFGTITEVLPLLTSTAFPFFNFEFNSEILFGSTPKTELADGSYLVNYQCTDGTDAFVNEQWAFFTCLSKRCKDDAVIKGASNRMTIENQLKIFLNYDYLLAGVGLGDKNFVDEQVDAMRSLCERCGCGC